MMEQILTTYWSQTVLVLAGIGYLAKVGLDMRSKRKEINYSLFQQQKLAAVNNFFSRYSEAELMWNNLALYDVFNREYSVEQLDEIVFTKLNALRVSGMELQIYFAPPKQQLFNELVEGMMSLNGVIQKHLWNPEKIKTTIKVNDFNHEFSVVKLRAKETLMQVTSEMRESFN